ncbi:hypothetical protein L1887_28327 [Cichorium endivia]|nr:hypothetical protein L1887_28327 [Cichorium endivia]
MNSFISIDLSKNSKTGEKENTVATPERVKSFKTDEDPSLVELLFQYGRDLLISCLTCSTEVSVFELKKEEFASRNPSYLSVVEIRTEIYGACVCICESETECG